MGEITRVDRDRLHGVANRVCTAADEIDDVRWPGLEPGALPGSAVVGIAEPTTIAARVADVTADIRTWVLAARASADALERADREHGDRFGG